jgi:hypothetical protein
MVIQFILKLLKNNMKVVLFIFAIFATLAIVLGSPQSRYSPPRPQSGGFRPPVQPRPIDPNWRRSLNPPAKQDNIRPPPNRPILPNRPIRLPSPVRPIRRQ